MKISKFFAKRIIVNVAVVLSGMPYLASAQNVSNLAELESRLSSSDGGETILLEPGHYGDLDVINKDYGSFVTIQSANTAKPAVFNSVSIQGTSYLRLDNVLLSNSSNGEAASSILSISGGSEFIEFINSEAHGLIDDDYSGHRIIDVEESSEVLIQNSFMHNGFRVIVLDSSAQIKIIGNTFEDVGGDEIKIIGIRGITIENNTGATRKHPIEGDHVDFIQGESTSSYDMVIRGNVSLPEGRFTQQGIFLSDTTFHNVLIENNLIYSELIRAIQVDDGSTEVVIRNNTLFDIPEITSTKASAIFAPDSATLENNVYTSSIDKVGMDGSNLVIQHTHDNRNFFYNDYYRNPFAGPGVTIHDLTPVEGEITESLGAFEKINDLFSDVVDSDNDSIRDSWELEHFPNLAATNGSSDSDSDGTNDFLEFLQDSDPHVGDSRRSLLGVVINKEDGETGFSWTVNRELNYGIDYELEVSTDLGSWQKLEESDYELKTVQAGSGMEKLTMTMTNSTGDQLFARIAQVTEEVE